MTPGHILFIPGTLLIGMFLGFIFGARAARAAKRAAASDKSSP